MKKRLISMALAASMAFSILPTPVLAAGGGTALTAGQSLATQAAAQTIDNEADLRNAVKTSGTYTLANDITLTGSQSLTIPSGVTVTLDLGGRTLTVDDSFSNNDGVIDIKSTGNLTLVNGTLDANSRTRGVYMYGGTFTLGDGTTEVTIQNGSAPSNSYNGEGGGVYASGNPTYPAQFTMESNSTITSCVANYDYSSSNSDGGGGAVRTQGAGIDFVMKAGSTISNCEVKKLGAATACGGALFLGANSEVYGTITDCTAEGNPASNDVMNYGKIVDGVFTGNVRNYGTIAGGSFSGEFRNEGLYPQGAYIKDGTFTGSVANKGNIDGGTFEGQVTNNRYILGGTFKDTVINKSQITKYTSSTVTGTFMGEVKNESGGTIKYGTFTDTSEVTNLGKINGGSYAGTVTNNVTSEGTGEIQNGTFEDTGDVTNFATITNGTFKGKVTNENTGKVDYGDFTGAKFTNNGGTVNSNDTITKYELTLTDAAAKAGTNPVNSGDKLMAGTEVTLTAGAAPEGKEFDKWEVTGENGAVTGTESTDADGSHVYTFTMPTENVTAKATFKAKTYKITVTGGYANVQTEEAGKTITLTAEPGEGQELDYWTVNGTKINGNTFEMTEEDVTAVATFKAIVTPDPASYTITVTGGTADKQTAPAGETITLTAEPGDGQELDYWTVNGTKIDGNTFVMPEEDVTAEATFKAIVTPDPVPEPAQGGGDDLGGAVVAVAAAGAAVWGGYELATRIILHQFLPEGAAIPTNRGALAQLIWQNAGSPEPEATPAFADMTDDAAKAAQWCVEQGIMEAREDGKFEPDGWIPKFRVIEVWNKAFPQ